MMTTIEKPTQLELYFQQFRDNIIGINQEFESPYGRKQIRQFVDFAAIAVNQIDNRT